MGNKVPSAMSEKNEVEAAKKSMCTCADIRTAVVEKERTPLTDRTRKAAQDFLFSLTYYRKQPRTLIGKINFGLYLATFEVCSTFCCPPCPASIIQKLAFQPPPKPTYNLEPFGGGKSLDIDYRLELKPAAAVFNRFLYRRCQAYPAQFHCFYIGGRHSANRIACAYARTMSPSPTSRPLTLLYSHSNGMDIGYCAGYLAFLSRRLRVDVFCYDYPGYGRSGGPCSESRLYNCIETVYDFLTKKLLVPWQQIVAVGTSLGTAASIHLVGTAQRPVKGVVLQGGFMSALRVLCPKRQKTSRLDQFVSIDKIVKVTVPTLLVHGCKDGLFAIVHAISLRKMCPGAAKIQPLFIKEGLHVDFEDYLAYWKRLHTFFHTELAPPAPEDAPCCSYHPSELKRRDPHLQAGKSASLSAHLSGKSPKPKRRIVPAPVIVCEHCLSIDKISQSTAAFNLMSGKSKEPTEPILTSGTAKEALTSGKSKTTAQPIFTSLKTKETTNPIATTDKSKEVAHATMASFRYRHQ